jgi:hypothetical protein
MSEHQLEFSERTAREILDTLQEEFGSLLRLRAAYRLLRCAEELLELCAHNAAADDWQSLGDAARRVVNKIPPNNE